MKTRAHNLSGKMLLALSGIALITALTGFFQSPQQDEGTAAHIFQLSVVTLIPMAAIFVSTTDWKNDLRALAVLAYSGAMLAIAFATVYYLEHVFYLTR